MSDERPWNAAGYEKPKTPRKRNCTGSETGAASGTTAPTPGRQGFSLLADGASSAVEYGARAGLPRILKLLDNMSYE
jgi:hypothetical protein